MNDGFFNFMMVAFPICLVAAIVGVLLPSRFVRLRRVLGNAPLMLIEVMVVGFFVDALRTGQFRTKRGEVITRLGEPLQFWVAVSFLLVVGIWIVHLMLRPEKRRE